jgi:hypothetical protein
MSFFSHFPSSSDSFFSPSSPFLYFFFLSIKLFLFGSELNIFSFHSISLSSFYNFALFCQYFLNLFLTESYISPSRSFDTTFLGSFLLQRSLLLLGFTCITFKLSSSIVFFYINFFSLISFPSFQICLYI